MCCFKFIELTIAVTEQKYLHLNSEKCRFEIPLLKKISTTTPSVFFLCA